MFHIYLINLYVIFNFKYSILTFIYWFIFSLFVLRMENINITNRSSQAKVVGTMVTLAGATIMTLVKGPVLYGSVGANSHHHHSGGLSVLGTRNSVHSLRMYMLCYFYNLQCKLFCFIFKIDCM
jgi:hypothetical protein